MKNRLPIVPIWKRHFLLVLLSLVACAISFSGCRLANQLIFSSPTRVHATPARYDFPFEEIWFPAKDGIMLNGWLVEGSPDLPMVVYFHGNAGNLADGVEYIRVFRSLGFTVFIFDYRGYGKSSGVPDGENDLYNDARGALDYLAGRGYPAASMIYYGQSLGAAIAIQMSLERAPAGLVLESCFTSLADVALHLAPLAYLFVGWWNIEDQYDNVSKIGKVSSPILFVHGGRDMITPVEMSRQLFALAREPKAFHLIPSGGHCDAFSSDGEGYRRAWRHLLSAVLRGQHG